MVGIVVAGVSLMPRIDQQLFPPFERAQVVAYLDMPKGTDIDRTRGVALRFSDWLTGAANPEVTGTTTFVGSGGPRFVLAIDPADADPASSLFVINTQTFEATGPVLDRARAHAATAFPEASIRVKRLSMGGSEPGVDVEISGPDAETLPAAAYEVEALFAALPGLTENRNDWGARRLVGTVEIAQDCVREYGPSSAEVANALDAFFDGRRISTFRDGDDLVPIVLPGAPEDRRSFEALANAAIEADGQVLPLDQLAQLVPRLEFSSIRRVDQVRTVTVTAISDRLTAFDLYDRVAPDLAALQARLGPTYDIAIGGEIENAAEVRTLLGAGLPVAAAVMSMALMVQFNRFRRVAITLLSIPLVIAGVAPALDLTGQPLSFFGILGLIALAGIIVNDAIVLIDQIEIERAEREVGAAIVEAARKRFRPIALTSMTTVIGLSPMALAGGAIWGPMATLMMGGPTGAALLALVWIPAPYRIGFPRGHDADTARSADPAAA